MVGLTKFEIGLFVITMLTEDDNEFEATYSKIKKYRAQYNVKVGNVQKKKFAVEHLKSTAERLGLEDQTLIDYADSNSRYALMSGLFNS